jgi:hypothetical protein
VNTNQPLVLLFAKDQLTASALQTNNIHSHDQNILDAAAVTHKELWHENYYQCTVLHVPEPLPLYTVIVRRNLFNIVNKYRL